MIEQLENALKEITSHLQYYGTLSDEEEALGNLCAAIDTAIRQAIAAEREACAKIVLEEIEARRAGEATTDRDAFYLMGGVAAGIKIGNRISARSEGGEG